MKNFPKKLAMNLWHFCQLVFGILCLLFETMWTPKSASNRKPSMELAESATESSLC